MNQPATSAILDLARQALVVHDPDAQVELADGGELRVYSILSQDKVYQLLLAVSLPVMERDPGKASDCCGGCGGG